MLIGTSFLLIDLPFLHGFDQAARLLEIHVLERRRYDRRAEDGAGVLEGVLPDVQREVTAAADARAGDAGELADEAVAFRRLL